jgi:hypothetical protein
METDLSHCELFVDELLEASQASEDADVQQIIDAVGSEYLD